MQIANDPQQIESKLIHQLFSYWQSLCGDNAIPRRGDIDPAAILPFLPNILLVDFEQDPFRIKFRLVGTKIVEVTGFEFTGKYFDEIAMPDVEAPFLEAYHCASLERLPVFTRATWRFDETTTGTYDFCILPLEDDGRVATKAIAAECYDRLEKQYSLSELRTIASSARMRRQ